MFIYKTTNLINGMIYIGQHSKNKRYYKGSGSLLRDEFKIYGGKNFKREILEDGIETLFELNERETFWIKEFNSKYPNGYNLTDGGSGNTGHKHTEEYKEYLFELNSGKAVKVYQYTLEGIFIREYRSVKNASINTGVGGQSIFGVINKKHYTAGGFIWSDHKLTQEELDVIFINMQYYKNCICVYQYDLNYNFIKFYRSIKDASNDNNLDSTHIGNCIKGRRLHAGYFIWSDHELTEDEKVPRAIKKTGKPVCQYTMDDILVKEYKSGYQALQETGICHIKGCCRGERISAGGYKWKYKNQ